MYAHNATGYRFGLKLKVDRAVREGSYMSFRLSLQYIFEMKSQHSLWTI